MRKAHIVTITIPEEILKKAKEYAYRNGMTLSGLIRLGLEEKLKE